MDNNVDRIICNTEIGKFICEHENWENLLLKEPYCLKIKRDGDYIMFNYNQLSSDFNIPLVREARGIIFRYGMWATPVCHAFDKFGNYGESYVPKMDFNQCVVTEKVDGSLIKIWCDELNGVWHISTNGTIDANKCTVNSTLDITFGQLVNTAIKNTKYNSLEEFILSNFDYQTTYMFELVSPYNRVVIPYKDCKLYYLGKRNVVTGDETFFFSDESCPDGIDIPKIYPLKSLENIINASRSLPWDKEGYVVCQDTTAGSKIRCKIKSPAYVLAHYVRNNNNISIIRLINIILQNQKDEFLIYASDYKQKLLEIEFLLKDISDYCTQDLTKLKPFLDDNCTKKEWAEKVNACHSISRPYLFCCYNNPNLSFKEFSKDWTAEKWSRMIDLFLSYQSDESTI